MKEIQYLSLYSKYKTLEVFAFWRFLDLDLPCVGLFFVGIELSSPFSPMLRRDSIDLNPPHSTQETEKQICDNR